MIEYNFRNYIVFDRSLNNRNVFNIVHGNIFKLITHFILAIMLLQYSYTRDR